VAVANFEDIQNVSLPDDWGIIEERVYYERVYFRN